MDFTDKQILDHLKSNGKATASEISKVVNLSLPAVSERIRKLNKNGIIEQYTVRLNRKKLGFGLLAMVFVNIQSTENIVDFRREITAFPEVIECHHIAGEYDYLLKILMRDTVELEDFLTKKLKNMPGVAKTNTLIIDISNNRGGSITIDIPGDILGAMYKGSGVPFAVAVDGWGVGHEERFNADGRTLTIPFPDGSKRIEIVGRQSGHQDQQNRAGWGM